MFVRLNNITINCMLAALLSALFASCKDETDEDAESYKAKADKGAICFSTYTSGATRAAEVGADDVMNNGFYVSAWYGGALYFSDGASYTEDINADKIFDTEAETYYWPTLSADKSIDFRAFNISSGGDWVDGNCKSIKFEVEETAFAQKDLVVAYASAKTRPDQGVQPLNFIHALSKINFSFTGADAEYKYTVNRVEVIAAGKGGPTMSFNTTTDNTNPNTQAGMVSWTFTKIEEVNKSKPIVKKYDDTDKGAAQGILFTYHKEDSDASGVDKNIGLVVNGTETKNMDDNLMLFPQDGMIAIRVYYKVEDGEGNLIGNCGYYRTNTKGNHDVKMKDGKVDNSNDAVNYFYRDKDDKDNGVLGCKTIIVNIGTAITNGWQAGKSYRFIITLPTDNFKGDISGDGVADDLYEGKDLDGDGDGEESEFGMDEGYIEFSVSVKPWVDENYNTNIVIK